MSNLKPSRVLRVRVCFYRFWYFYFILLFFFFFVAIANVDAVKLCPCSGQRDRETAWYPTTFWFVLHFWILQPDNVVIVAHQETYKKSHWMHCDVNQWGSGQRRGILFWPCPPPTFPLRASFYSMIYVNSCCIKSKHFIQYGCRFETTHNPLYISGLFTTTYW